MTIATLNNSALILLINVGDILIGVYLMQIAVMDTIVYGTQYCSERLKWLSSVHCSIVGVLSTIGYEMSLISMTCLGLVRVVGIRNGMGISCEISKRAILKTCLIMVSIVKFSATIAGVPLVSSLEDFFVNGITYDPSVRLFIGSPGKAVHLDILQAYYGKIKQTNLKWRVINDLVADMFSDDYGGDTLGRKKLDFYGNEGVCLFKFFVEADDPQRIYVWAVLVVNMICLAVMSSCYIFININAKTSSKILTSEKTPMRDNIKARNRKLQRKISLLIATNLLCWLPVTILSCLHSGGIFDATSYYSIISIAVLPINSVINPVLYNDFFIKLMGRFFEKMAGIIKVHAVIKRDPVVPTQGNRECALTTGQPHEVDMIEMKTLTSFEKTPPS
jgi:hypothetical protein